MIECIDSKLISVCLINDYSLIDDPNIFVYGSTECATISLECTKVKLVNVLLNNFEHSYQKKLYLNINKINIKPVILLRHHIDCPWISGGL